MARRSQKSKWSTIETMDIPRSENSSSSGTSLHLPQLARLELGQIISRDKETQPRQVSIRRTRSLALMSKVSALVNQSLRRKSLIIETTTGHTNKSSLKLGISRPQQSLARLKRDQNHSRSKEILLVLANTRPIKNSARK